MNYETNLSWPKKPCDLVVDAIQHTSVDGSIDRDAVWEEAQKKGLSKRQTNAGIRRYEKAMERKRASDNLDIFLDAK